MEAQTVNAHSLIEIGSNISAARPLLIRGAHGIGKSSIVYQIATKRFSDKYKNFNVCWDLTRRTSGEAGVRRALDNFWTEERKAKYEPKWHNVWHYDMGLPVIERRLSQVSDGDLVGIPTITNRGTTIFNICDWLMVPMEFPCVLFFDELNRATKQLEQSTFQLADSRAFHGHLLHDDTWMVVAINTGANYDVSLMDAAGISRYVTFDYTPSTEDWITYARPLVSPELISFIIRNENLLDSPKNHKPEAKTPDRRAYLNLDAELQRLGLYDQPNNPLFLLLAGGMIGPNAALLFRNFLLEQNFRYSITEVLENWVQFRTKLSEDMGERSIQMIDLVGRLGDYLTKHPLTENQAIEIVKLFQDTPIELVQKLFGDVSMFARTSLPNKVAMKELGKIIAKRNSKDS